MNLQASYESFNPGFGTSGAPLEWTGRSKTARQRGKRSKVVEAVADAAAGWGSPRAHGGENGGGATSRGPRCHFLLGQLCIFSAYRGYGVN